MTNKILDGPGFYKYCYLNGGFFDIKSKFTFVELDEDGYFYVFGSDESYSLEQLLRDGYFLYPIKRIQVFTSEHNQSIRHLMEARNYLNKQIKKEPIKEEFDNE